MFLFLLKKRLDMRKVLWYNIGAARLRLHFHTSTLARYARLHITTSYWHFGAGCACNFFSPRHSFALSLLVFSKNRLYLFPVPFFLSRLGLKYRKYFKPCGRICQVFSKTHATHSVAGKKRPKKIFSSLRASATVPFS